MARLRLDAHIVPASTRFAEPILALLMKSLVPAALCVAAAVCAQAQEPQKSSGDESWSTTKENSAQNVNPSRTTESHTKSGNRTVDKQKLEVLGPNGRYQPFSETETETIQVDATTTKTVVRTYQWNGNGQRVLAQVTEENSRTTTRGDTRVERKTSNADVNGNLQVARREVEDTKKVSPGVEETKTTVYRADSYGGFTQSEQTKELKTQGADNTVAVKKTTLVPDGNGSWKVNDVTEKTTTDNGKSCTTDERVSRPDLNGRLQESSRTVSKEAETPTGEKRSTVESYDGANQLNKRVTKIQKKGSAGEVTEEQIEQPNLGNPSDGARVTGRTKYVVQYAGPGTQATKTVEVRDANGNFHTVSSDTKKSTQPATTQAPQPPPPNQKSEAPPAKQDAPSPKP
jgi:hypothetical protein